MAGGAVGTSGGHQASVQSSRTSVVELLATVVVGNSWHLGRMGPYGLVIGSAVCDMVAMVEMAQWELLVS